MCKETSCYAKKFPHSTWLKELYQTDSNTIFAYRLKDLINDTNEMIGVFGHGSALVRLYCAGNNLG